MTSTPNARETLPRPIVDILNRLPHMGRVMLTAEAGGATHERIGPVESVEIAGVGARLRGPFHESELALDALSRIVIDRTGRMGEKAMPRLDFENPQGEKLYSIIGLDGLEPFDAALAPLGGGLPAEPRAPVAAAPKADPEIPRGDLGAITFAALFAAAAPVVIELRRPGLSQRWRGAPPEPRHAMGFVNVMRGDFHLHLKAGAVSAWRAEEKGDDLELVAEDVSGAPMGLVVRGPRAALAEALK